MRRLGLIGGMSWEFTLSYYRMINEGVRKASAPDQALRSADLILHSLDFQEIVALQTSGRWAEAGERLAQSARGLEQVGAQAIMICTNTMHLVADVVQAAVEVPVIHLLDITASHLKARGLKRPLLLATRYTMEHGFYVERMQRHDIHPLTPGAEDRTACQAIIFEELCAGIRNPCSRGALASMIQNARDEGADCAILGCTELGLLLNDTDEGELGLQIFELHATSYRCRNCLLLV